ncbi:MAG: hypothetical protein RLZZ292_2908 [Bacteroidota bacterium]|jgi:hypothetical protein
MTKLYIEDKKYNNEDFSQKALAKGEYENCIFIDIKCVVRKYVVRIRITYDIQRTFFF